MLLRDMQDGYVELVRHVRSQGEQVAPRGYKTRELRNFTYTLGDPTRCLPVGVGREARLAIGAAESVLLVGGISDAVLLSNIAPNFRRFLDGGILAGAYGPRIAPQLPQVVEKLRRDADTRQAVMTVFDPAFDHQDLRDVPCTIAIGFHLRWSRLYMSVLMRSQDVWLGVPYDVMMFSALQLSVANALAVKPGTLAVTAWSLHVYERDLEKVERLHPYDWDSAPRQLHGIGHPGSPVNEVVQRARRIHSGHWPLAPTSTERWYVNVLKQYDRLTATENFTT